MDSFYDEIEHLYLSHMGKIAAGYSENVNGVAAFWSRLRQISL